MGARHRWTWVGVVVGLSCLVGCGQKANPIVATAGGIRVSRSEVTAAVVVNQALQGARFQSTRTAFRSQSAIVAEQQLVVSWALSHHLITRQQARLQAQHWMMARRRILSPRLQRFHASMAAVQHYVACQIIIASAFSEVTKEVQAPSRAFQQRYYQNNSAFFATPAEILLRNITVPTRGEAESLLRQIHAGASFSALAERDSRDPDRRQGGSRGWIALGASAAVPAQWMNAMSHLRPGQMSIVPDALGYSIVEVQAFRTGAAIPFRVVQPAIQTELVDEAKSALFDKWAAQLVHNHPVRVMVR